MFNKKTVKDVNLKNKTVLLRADYNVPLNHGRITDDYRIKQSLPTINYLLKQNTKLVICSHLGRPNGEVDRNLSLEPVAKALSQLLDKPVKFAHDCVGKTTESQIKELKSGEILLLENLRFHPGEEADSKDFAEALADDMDVFVQDGFGVVHRAHASTQAITKILPSVAGLLLEKEINTISGAMENPERPLAAIIGGAKISDKIEIIKRFIHIADVVAIGGALANPFLKAKGLNIEGSLYEPKDLSIAKDILKAAERETAKRSFVFLVPHDVVVARSTNRAAPTRIVDFSSNSFADIMYYPKLVPPEAIELSPEERILDIGPFSAALIAGGINLCQTVVWNGTMGVTEVASIQGSFGPFAHATETVIEAMLGDLGHKPFSIVGGGDTVGYVQSRHLTDEFNHVSTGGGASLELMSGHKLPGVEALADK